MRLVTGNISVPTSASFSGTEGNISVTGTPVGTVSQPTFSGIGKRLVLQDYTPAGSVSQPTFSNGAVTASGSYTPAGSVATSTATTSNKTTTVSKASSGDITFTPEGSINVTLTQTNTNATVTYA